jgi:hypothetical protein
MNSVPDPIRGYCYNGMALPSISLDIVDYEGMLAAVSATNLAGP